VGPLSIARKARPRTITDWQLPVVPAAADRVTRRPEQDEDETHDQHDDADRPENGDLRNEADDEQDKTEDDHRILL
jgi:hypothetical protein